MYLSIWNYVQTLWERWFRSRSVTNNLFIWMNLVWVTIVCSDIWTFVPEAATCCYSAEDCSVRWHRQTSSAKKELFVLSTLVRHWRKRVNASLRAVQFQWERRRWGSCNAWGWQLRSCIPKFFATWYYMLPFPVLEWTSWLEWLCFNILKLFCVVVSYLDTDFQHVSSVCVGRLKRLAGGHGVQSGTMSNEATWLYGIQSLISSAYLLFELFELLTSCYNTVFPSIFDDFPLNSRRPPVELSLNFRRTSDQLPIQFRRFQVDFEVNFNTFRFRISNTSD